MRWFLGRRARSRRSDRGATSVEYGLIIGGVALVVIPGIFALRSASQDAYQTTSAQDAGVCVGAGCNAIDTLPGADVPAAGVLKLTGYLPTSGTINKTFSSKPTRTGGAGPYQYTITSGSIPAGTTLSASTGWITGTPSAVGTTTAVIQVRDSLGAVASATVNLTIAYPKLYFTGYTTTSGFVGTAFTASPITSGGTGFGSTPFSLTAGALPGGLVLNQSTGVISGTPTTKGTFTFTVTVTDTQSQTASLPVTMTIADVGFINPYGTTTVLVGSAVSVNNPGVSGGTLPYSFSLTGVTWLSVDGSGKVTGIAPNTPGTYTYTVKVRDANNNQGSADGQVVVVGNLALADYPATTVSTGSSVSLPNPGISGGFTPYTYQLTSGPGWLSVNSSGVVSGVAPGTATVENFTVTVTDDKGNTDTGTGTVTVVAALNFTGDYATEQQGKGATFSIPRPGVSGGSGTLSYTINNNGHNWINVSPTTGVVSGTTPNGANAPGVYSFTVTVKDQSVPQQSDTATGSVVVSGGAISFGAYGDTTVTAGGAFSVPRPAVSGGSGDYTYTKMSGATWITVNQQTGVVSGTAPTSTGTNGFSVRVTDSSDSTGVTRSGNIVVVAALGFSSATFSPVSVGNNQNFTVPTNTVSGGTGGYTYTISGPSWINVNKNTGAVSGKTPNNGSGTVTYTVTVEDSSGNTATADGQVTY